MFSTLVESRAPRARSTRGAMVSVVVHGMVIAAAVALTVPRRIEARPEPPRKPLVFLAAPSVPRPPAVRQPMQDHVTASATLPQLSLRALPIPAIPQTALPPIELRGPDLPDLVILGGNHSSANRGAGPGGMGDLPSGGIVSAGLVDQVPRLIGSVSPPRYPAALRTSGMSGRVVVRFVVDTLGRAEAGDVVMVEATHALFADAVREALDRYRFSPGVVEGRKVRTLVQLPFTFSLRP